MGMLPEPTSAERPFGGVCEEVRLVESVAARAIGDGDMSSFAHRNPSRTEVIGPVGM